MKWPLVKLGEVCKFVRGPFGGALKKECFVEDGFAIYEQQHAIYNQFSEIRYFVDEIKFNELKRFMLNPGDLIMSCSGTMGKIAIVPDNIKTGIINQALLKLTPSEAVDINYLKYWLESESFQFILNGMTHGAAIKNVASVAVLKEIEIPLPPLDEQKRIAAILDKADAIRRKRQQAIQLADDFLRSVFLDMFGDPVTNPKGWEVKKFSDLGNWASGGTPSRSVSGYFEGEINWFSARELNHRYLNESVEKITDAALSKSAAKIFPAGSMLVGMYDTAAFKISILNVASASNQACANIIPNEKIDIEWFFSFIEFSKETYLRQRRGVRQQNLNLGMIKDFDLPLPPKTEQEKFVKLAHKTMQMKERNYSSLSNSLDSFNSLSQKAFAGDL